MVEESIINELISLEHVIKSLKLELDNYVRREEELKALIIEDMQGENIDVIENEEIRIKYIAPVTRETVDTSKLKKDFPEVAHSCLKQNEVKATWKITLKGE